MRAAPALLGLLLIAYEVLEVRAGTRTVACCSFAELAGNLTISGDGDYVLVPNGVYTVSPTFPLPIVLSKSVGISGGSFVVFDLRGRSGFVLLNSSNHMQISDVIFRNGRNLFNITSAASLTLTNHVNFVNTSASPSPNSAGLLVSGTATISQSCFNGSFPAGASPASFFRVYSGGTLQITQSTFIGITADTGSAAVEAQANTDVTIGSTLFTSCTTAPGGNLILTAGTLTLANSTFDRNTAGTNVYANASSSITITNVVFTNNYGTSSTGAANFVLNGAVAIITDSSFSNNTGVSSGCISAATSFTLLRSNFTSNSAMTNGGAIGGLAPDATIVGCTFTSNRANSLGGAIMFAYSGSIHVNDTTFNANSALGYGGAVSLVSFLQYFSNVLFKNNVAQLGGAVHTSSQALTSLINSLAVNNTGTLGGGFYSGLGTVSAASSNFTDNLSPGHPGGVFYFGGASNPGIVSLSNCMLLRNSADSGGVGFGVATLTIVNSVISSNTAVNNAGCFQAGTYPLNVTVSGSTFNANTATACHGGVFGVAFTAGVFLTASASTFTNNRAGLNGGVVQSGVNATLINCLFSGNSAVRGGVINGGSVYALNSAFTGNTVSAAGGALALTGTATLRNSNFTSNSGASANGGAINIVNAAGPNAIVGCRFVTNSGGAVACAGDITLTGSTFIGNTAANSDAAGMFVYSNAVNVYVGGCAFSANHGGQVLYLSSSATQAIVNSTMIGNTAISTIATVTVATVSGCVFSACDKTAVALQIGALITNSSFLNSATSSSSSVNSNAATIIGCTFSGLSTTSGSGAAINSIQSVTVIGSTFRQCTATAGGAIYSAVGATIMSSTFDQCSASGNGGAVNALTTLSVSGTTFTACTAASLGGAAYAGNAATVALLGGTRFTSNTAGTYGGGVATLGTLNIADTAFSGNSVTGGSGAGGAVYAAGALNATNLSCNLDAATSGGCIYAVGTTTDIRRAVITGTSATNGGGVYLTGAYVNLTDVTIANAISGISGGGVYQAYVSSSPVPQISFNRLSITGVRSTLGGGAGIYSYVSTPGATVSVTNSYFDSNTAGGSTGGGGAIYALMCNGNFTLFNSTLSNNQAVYNGGGLNGQGASFTVVDSTIVGNIADTGGGLYMHDGAYSLLGNTRVTCNLATTKGAALACSNAAATVAASVQLATGSGASPGADVACMACTGACYDCGMCNGGCRQSGSVGCYKTQSACTSCPSGYIGVLCDTINGTSCAANLGCPARPIGQTCQIACNNVSLPNPNITLPMNVTCLSAAGWTYANACIACPPHHYGANCAQVVPVDCAALPGGLGIVTSCPGGYAGDTCIPSCDATAHYQRNPLVALPIRCQGGSWNVSAALCTVIPPNCPVLPSNATAGISVGCSSGYVNDTCAPVCADNFTLSAAYAFATPLTCNAVGGWVSSPPLCVACGAGYYGFNCSQRFVNFCPPASASDVVNASLVGGPCMGRVGDVCAYACATSNVATTPLTRTCLPTGAWSNSVSCTGCGGNCATCNTPGTCTSCIGGWSVLPLCNVVTQCGSFGSRANYTSDCTTVNSVPYLYPCHISCVFDPSLTTTIFCVEFLTWSAINVSCPDNYPSAPPPAIASPPPPPTVTAPPSAPPDAATATAGASQIVSPTPAPPSSTGAIVGAVVAVAVLLALLILVLVVFQRRKKSAVPMDGDATLRVESGAGKRVEKMLKNAPVLGRGMTAIVYRGVLEDDTPVAIKVATGTSQQASVEFHREAHFLGLLMGGSHKHIIGMRFYCDNPRAIVMELADGGSVRNLLKDGRPKEALDIVRQTAEGINALHDNNIAHLDLKPENILIGSDGLYKITDLGCAVSCLAGAESVPSGTFVGTPQYSSPERFLIGVVDPKAADVYSFAITIWSIFEATSPLAKDTYDTLVSKVSSDTSFPLKELSMAPDTPPSVLQAVLLGIKRDINQRGTIRQLRELLEQHVEGSTIGSVSSGLGSTGSSVLVQNPAFASGAGDSMRISLFDAESGVFQFKTTSTALDSRGLSVGGPDVRSTDNLSSMETMQAPK